MLAVQGYLRSHFLKSSTSDLAPVSYSPVHGYVNSSDSGALQKGRDRDQGVCVFCGFGVLCAEGKAGELNDL